MSENEMPDWPPAASAFQYREGSFHYGSTGQLFVVKNQQWVRVGKPKIVGNVENLDELQFGKVLHKRPSPDNSGEPGK